MEKESKKSKRFRIWHKIHDRRFCFGENLEELLVDIRSRFKFSSHDQLELRMGKDGTIIDSDFDFQEKDSILVVFNQSNGEKWIDEKGWIYEEISTVEGNVPIFKNVWNNVNHVQMGYENVILEPRACTYNMLRQSNPVDGSAFTRFKKKIWDFLRVQHST